MTILMTEKALLRTQSAHLAKQRRLIKRCIETESRLVDVLAAADWTYDDLRYLKGHEFPSAIKRPITLENIRQKAGEIPLVSFFSGAGGLDLGLEAAGFSHAALVEHNPLFCKTLRHNRPAWTVLGPPFGKGDVSNVDEIGEALTSVIGHSTFPGVFVGGPPCQPFSIAANQRFSRAGKDFKRIGFDHRVNGNLLFNFVALISRFKPGAFLIENVPGLLELDGGVQLRNACDQLAKLGYSVSLPTILEASRLGVPQSRRRLFVVGNRLGRAFQFPMAAPSRLPCAETLSRTMVGAFNHETRAHTAHSVARYMELQFGERDQLGRVDRLDPSLPSKTVIAGGTSGGGRSHLHPLIPRTLSVRESARLQTFPDTYEFLGTASRQFTQVGNAVPPVLAARLGIAILESIFAQKGAK